MLSMIWHLGSLTYLPPHYSSSLHTQSPSLPAMGMAPASPSTWKVLFSNELHSLVYLLLMSLLKDYLFNGESLTTLLKRASLYPNSL